MIDNVPWLPCSHCGWMRPDCTCKTYPVSDLGWEQALQLSAEAASQARLTARRVAEWRQLTHRKAAA